MNSPRRLAIILWIFLFVFCLRVLGQMLVPFAGVSWLPPMEAWIPRNSRVFIQSDRLGFFTKIDFDDARVVLHVIDRTLAQH